MTAPAPRSQPRPAAARQYATTLEEVLALRSENAALEAALREMIQTQDDWETGVAKIIGRQPEIFTRAIDRARAALPQSSGSARTEQERSK